MKIEHLSVLATVVVAFAASTALILNGQSELRRDMWAGQSEIRKDMRAGQSELRKDMRAGQAELRKDMRAGQAELHKDLRAVEAELRAGQTEIRKDLKSIDVRLAVVEQRPPRSPAGTGAPGAGPAPTALLNGRPHSPRISLLQVKAAIAQEKSMAAGGLVRETP